MTRLNIFIPVIECCRKLTNAMTQTLTLQKAHGLNEYQEFVKTFDTTFVYIKRLGVKYANKMNIKLY